LAINDTSAQEAYVGGYAKAGEDDNIQAVMWKNGVPQYLTDGTYDVTIESVFVSGDNVYASGGEKGGGSSGIYYFAKIWVNGEVQTLTDGSTNARGNSIFVSDGNVYVGGYE